MSQRPTSITVIAWILIVLGACSLVGLYFTWKMFHDMALQPPGIQALMAKNPLPVSVQLVLMGAGGVVHLLCGVFLLRGVDWARWLYAVWIVAVFILGVVTSPAKLMLLPSLLLYGVVGFYLFRPVAAAYFTGADRDGI